MSVLVDGRWGQNDRYCLTRFQKGFWCCLPYDPVEACAGWAHSEVDCKPAQ